MMDVLIIEDEIPAQQILVKLIKTYYPDFNIIGALDSVKSATEYFRGAHSPNLVFMDVELSDGHCFDIFEAVDIRCPVIITTAYEDYALDAFKAKCMDYLMKPIEPEAFRESVDRCLQLCGTPPTSSPEESVRHYTRSIYKHRLTIKMGSRILVIDVHDIAYFHSIEKSTYVVTKDGKEYMVDDSLTSLESDLDPELFYKISRKCIIGIDSIRTISKYFNSRLKVTLAPGNIEPIIVPRERVQNFLNWLEGS